VSMELWRRAVLYRIRPLRPPMNKRFCPQ